MLAPGPQLALALLLPLSGCERVEPLSREKADQLLEAADKEQELFCRVEVTVIEGQARPRWGLDEKLSECIGALKKGGFLAARCLDEEAGRPCPGVALELNDKLARVVGKRLEVSCGTKASRASRLETAGDIAWITSESMFRVAADFGEAMGACRPVPAELPQTRTRTARWRDEWRLD